MSTPDRSLNLGVVAHVDAGKTSLTERLLYAAGVIAELGSVDAGSTRTDALALERQRGITIRSAVASFPLRGRTVNLIDTPGHPDFVAEVERALRVLDGVVLVVSAVEGVQAQTRVLMRILRRLRIPTLLFVNKLDRTGARYGPLLRELTARLDTDVLAMGAVDGLGTTAARFTPYGPGDRSFLTRLTEVVAEHDDEVLAAYLDDVPLPPADLRARLAREVAVVGVLPVYFGSAITGAGIDALAEGIAELLPAPRRDPDAPVAGSVFKVERGPAGEKIASVSLSAGRLRARDRVRFGDGRTAKVTAVELYADGAVAAVPALEAGRIGRVHGLAGVRVGDRLADPEGDPVRGPAETALFAPPTLETVVQPVRAEDGARLQVALTELAEQDPLIALRRDELRRETAVSLYGEVQKEVIQATLAAEYAVRATFRETTTLHVERLTGTGAAAEFIAVDPNPFLATVGLRVEPTAVGTGVEFTLDVELGSLPLAFVKAVEEPVRATLEQGLFGWPIPDCHVALTRSGYWARQSSAHGTFDKSMSSTAGDFRLLTPLVLVTALRQAGTTVHEPLHRFRIDLPADAVRPVLAALARLRAVPDGPTTDGRTAVLEGELPAAAVHRLEQLLPGLSRGEGVLETEFARYRAVTGVPPTRRRTDHDPRHRREYLLHVQRRV